VRSEKYDLTDLIRQWLNDNGFEYEYDDYADFVLLYATAPTTVKVKPKRFTLGRGTWATNFLDADGEGEKRGIMILKDKIQIGGPNGGIIEIQAWEPSLFERLREYLS